jgi:transcriptional regulator with XRE-family HTH domain
VIKIKQVELARATGLSEPMISAILKGKRRPSWKAANELARVTDSPVEIWMNDDTGLKVEAVKKARGN